MDARMGGLSFPFWPLVNHNTKHSGERERERERAKEEPVLVWQGYHVQRKMNKNISEDGGTRRLMIHLVDQVNENQIQMSLPSLGKKGRSIFTLSNHLPLSLSLSLSQLFQFTQGPSESTAWQFGSWHSRSTLEDSTHPVTAITTLSMCVTLSPGQLTRCRS